MAVENDSYAKFTFRIVRSFGRRLGENPDELGMLLECQREIDAALRNAVTVARESYSLSWADVGQLLGVTRQAAQQRFGTAAERASTEVPGQTSIDDQLLSGAGVHMAPRGRIRCDCSSCALVWARYDQAAREAAAAQGLVREVDAESGS